MTKARDLANVGSVASHGLNFRNRIINGAMVIDQRNAGASINGNATYSLDRWLANASVTNKYTVQQNAGSVTPPAGFTNYLGVTSSSAYSVGAGEQFSIIQPIEGFNTADLDFGKATAKTITLSFWVRSSLTGTFGGSLLNGAGNRGYPYSYTISTANTWEQKFITIAGDTTGTWIGATNGIGLYVIFGLGVGSTLSGTAGVWAGSSLFSATGATSVVGTSGATFYITGVQLEVGASAAPFETRPYGQELALCQRYYESTICSSGGNIFADTYSTNGNVCQLNLNFNVAKRATPTMSTIGTFTIGNTAGAQWVFGNVNGFLAYYQPSTAGRVYWYPDTNSGWAASAEL